MACPDRLAAGARLSLHSLALCAALLTPPALAAAADTSAAVDENHVHCDSCDGWNEQQAPFKIYGNTWYVGTSGLSAILVTSPEGHVLFDGALPQSAAQIQANIEALGFRIGDVKLIVNSHEHFDHAGGIAALQRASGATVAASAIGARVLRQGTPGSDDPQFDAKSPIHIPRVDQVSEVADGQVLKVGTVAVTAHATPGHTPGATTWSWTACEAGQCRAVVYADSLNPVSSDDFRFSGGNGRPDLSSSFATSIAKLAALDCDIVLSTHPGATHTLEKQAARTATENPFVDPAGCRDYAAVAAERLKVRLADEGAPN
ncbi:MAG: subclass B3 metallo-beta-lactamase [Arenimonas sp.]|jgi:metallo-beta-lactamase class B